MIIQTLILMYKQSLLQALLIISFSILLHHGRIRNVTVDHELFISFNGDRDT